MQIANQHHQYHGMIIPCWRRKFCSLASDTLCKPFAQHWQDEEHRSFLCCSICNSHSSSGTHNYRLLMSRPEQPLAAIAGRAALPPVIHDTASLDPVTWTWRNAPPTRLESSRHGFDIAPASTAHTDLQHPSLACPAVSARPTMACSSIWQHAY